MAKDNAPKADKAAKESKAAKEPKATKAPKATKGEKAPTGAAAASAGVARLHAIYRDKIAPDLIKKFGYKSAMQVPRLTKITLNMGVSEAVADKKIMDNAVGDLTKIAGHLNRYTIEWLNCSKLNAYLRWR